MSSPIAVQRIRAVSFTVSDLDRACKFYTQALGFQAVSDVLTTGTARSEIEGLPGANLHAITLQLGDEFIELVQYLNVPGTPIPQDSRSNDLWFQHLAIVVSDLDRAYSHLQAFSVEAISASPQTIPPSNADAAGIRAFKFKDPDRHNLELIWFPPDQGQPKWHQQSDRLFLGIDHTAITIADTEESLHLYRDLLGMRIEGGSLNQGETQARLDGLAAAKVRITALRPAQGGLGIELLDYLIPATERPRPNNWRSSDITYMQVELVVNHLDQAVNWLHQHGVQVVSPTVVTFQGPIPYCQGCLIKDPNGHALLLATESRPEVD